ncbi:hypothetical protein BDQ12DRAFT_645878 [Crucibulum laeve]|uniref:Integral membrane protein n=1 Tax=Crucibulum laeve TaxID=68775 RepID=A0A5C3MC75_9AGAR|nr:hypothetical protein BDQ12DRAFT_645878 [Crucibulum laeve]
MPIHANAIEALNHKDIKRWHITLHPSVIKECAHNGMPSLIREFFHPTRAILTWDHGKQKQDWRSRDHRKHRHILLSPSTTRDRTGTTFWERLSHMTRLEYWNVSWWVAIAFTAGSIVWVVNGFIAFLPFCTSVPEDDVGNGWTAFLGATIFEIGSVVGMWEAWNRDDTAAFGWNVKRVLTGTRDEEQGQGQGYQKGEKEVLERDANGRRNPNGNRNENGDKENGSLAFSNPVDDEAPRKQWVWFSLDSHYFHELGFHGAFWQFWGATIFWISGFTAIPQIHTAIENNTPLLNGAFWSPQVVGGSGFIISATFLMLEAQNHWWKPEPLSVGWHVGFWNFIGAVGFTMCGAFGYASTSSHGAEYQSSLSTFWGGWAFLIGSVMQWYEAVNAT